LLRSEEEERDRERDKERLAFATMPLALSEKERFGLALPRFFSPDEERERDNERFGLEEREALFFFVGVLLLPLLDLGGDMLVLPDFVPKMDHLPVFSFLEPTGLLLLPLPILGLLFFFFILALKEGFLTRRFAAAADLASIKTACAWSIFNFPSSWR